MPSPAEQLWDAALAEAQRLADPMNRPAMVISRREATCFVALYDAIANALPDVAHHPELMAFRARIRAELEV